jgi:hypothetical protein
VPASPFVAVVLAGLALAGSAVAASSVVSPGKSLSQPGTVTPLALTGRTAAFAVGVSPAECRVKRWAVGTGTVTTFGLAVSPSCTIETSTGTGIASVSVATNRVAWLAYTGGNIREWSLFTARLPGAKPLRLRFVARGVDGPAPIVLGPGTPQGIPYAVGPEVVYLGEDGTRLFKTIASEPIALIAAGPGPNGIRVVALTAGGHILALGSDGNPVADDIVVDGAVSALRLFAGGVAYQTGSLVHVVGPSGETLVTLPPGSTMVDAAAGRILYQRMRFAHAGDLGAVTIATGADVLLVAGSRAKPVIGQLEAAGLTWARGTSVNWRPGPLPAA